MLRNAILVSLGLAMLVQGTAAHADDKEEAKKHFKNGLALLKAENIESAAVEFETAVKIYPTKGGMFNLANCYKTLGRYEEALNTLELMRGEFGEQLDTEYQATVAGLENEIKGMVAYLTVEVAENGAAILLEGKQVAIAPMAKPVMVGPGVHELEATLDGYAPARRKIKLSSGDEVTVRLELEREAPSAAAPVVAADGGGLSPLFWIGVAGTVAVGTVAGVFWGMRGNTLDEYDNYRNQYVLLSESDDPADQASANEVWGKLTDARDDAQTYKKVAIGTTIAAGALAAGTLIVLIVDVAGDDDGDGADAETAWRVVPAPGGIGVTF